MNQLKLRIGNPTAFVQKNSNQCTEDAKPKKRQNIGNCKKLFKQDPTVETFEVDNQLKPCSKLFATNRD